MSGAPGGAEASHIVLGVAFASKRMGYFVKDGWGDVLEYGVKDFTKSDMGKAISKVLALIEHCRPKTICLQDIRDPDCRLGDTSRDIIQTLERNIKKRESKLHKVSKKQVWKGLDLPHRTSKHEIARLMAEEHPATAHLLPEPRKLWDSEPRYMCMFMAMAGVSSLESKIVHAS